MSINIKQRGKTLKKLIIILALALFCVSLFAGDLDDITNEQMEAYFQPKVEQFFLDCIDGNAVDAIQMIDLYNFVWNGEDIGAMLQQCTTEDELVTMMAGLVSYIGNAFIEAGYATGYEFYEFRCSKRSDDYLLFYGQDYSGQTSKIVISIRDDKLFLQEITFQ
jgi:hypothetical protein